MKSWVRNSLRAGVIAAGFLLFASSPAHANDQVSLYNSGIASGNNVSVPIAAAANVCGNGIGALKGVGVGGSGICLANAQNESGSRTEDGQVSVGNSGIASGNNVSVPIAVAANVCGNGIGVLGGGQGGDGVCLANAQNGADDKKKHKGNNGYKPAEVGTENVMGPNGGNGNGGNGGGGQLSAFNSGVLSGNNVSVPIAAAANVCGNGIGALWGGGAGGSGACLANAQNESGSRHEDGQVSVGNSGLLSGNNVHIPVAVALNVCGNGIGIAGTGIGGDGVCVANAQNDGDDKGKKDGKKDGKKNGKHAKKEALPSVSTPLTGQASNLTQPLDAVTAPVTGGSSGLNNADVQLPASGNTVAVPGLS
ncbi:MAG: chaplin family protein [Micromonosporaceae bacterium]